MKTTEMIQFITEKLIPTKTLNLTPGRHELEGESYIIM